MFNLANSKEKLNTAGRLSHLLRWLLPNGERCWLSPS